MGVKSTGLGNNYALPDPLFSWRSPAPDGDSIQFPKYSEVLFSEVEILSLTVFPKEHSHSLTQ